MRESSNSWQSIPANELSLPQKLEINLSITENVIQKLIIIIIIRTIKVAVVVIRLYLATQVEK